MIKRIKKWNKPKKIVFAVITLILLYVIGRTVTWLIYYNSKIKPLYDSAREHNYQTADDGALCCEFQREGVRGGITLWTKGFWDFAGNISAVQGIEVDDDYKPKDKYNVEIRIYLQLNYNYWVEIGEVKEHGSGVNSGVSTSYIPFHVDKEMNLIDKDDHTDKEIEMFNSQKETIRILRDQIKETFGDWVFE